MLHALRISNYELIDHIDQDFYSGLNVITGETGTGKSMILSALGLICGNRASDKVNKDATQKCVLEAQFSAGEKLKALFVKNELDWEKSIILRREFSAQGRSRAFINDSPVNLDLLKQISANIIEIHSQDQTNSINLAEYQLGLLDSYSLLGDKLSTYKKYYIELENLSSLIRKKKNQYQKDKEELDFIQFQYDELKNTKILEGEISALESEKELLSKEDEIRLALESGSFILGEQDSNTLEQLFGLLNNFTPIQSVSPWLEEIHKRINELYNEVKDLQFEIESKKDNLELDPNKLTEIEDRLHSYYALENKFKVSGDKELIALMHSFKDRLDRIENSDEDIIKLEGDRKVLLNKTLKVGEEISKIRKKEALNFSKNIELKLRSLGIQHPQIEFRFSRLSDPEENGLDEVHLLFSSNKDQESRPIEEVASGGEKSRVMLSIKSILGNKKEINSMVFDEIDTGISGEVAIKTGELLAELGGNNQVISITHLPQVASKGGHHFKVNKEVIDNRTNVTMSLLDENNRVEELAEMLGGKNISESARKTAKQLLN